MIGDCPITHTGAAAREFRSMTGGEERSEAARGCGGMDGEKRLGHRDGRGEWPEDGAPGGEAGGLGCVEDRPAGGAGGDRGKGVLVGGEGGAEKGLEPGVVARRDHQVHQVGVVLARHDP